MTATNAGNNPCMTFTAILLVLAYGAMLGLIAKRELPASMQLPMWSLMASAGVGILMAAATLERVIGTTGLNYVRYPLMMLAGAAAVLILATLVRPRRATAGPAAPNHLPAAD